MDFWFRVTFGLAVTLAPTASLSNGTISTDVPTAPAIATPPATLHPNNNARITNISTSTGFPHLDPLTLTTPAFNTIISTPGSSITDLLSPTIASTTTTTTIPHNTTTITTNTTTTPNITTTTNSTTNSPTPITSPTTTTTTTTTPPPIINTTTTTSPTTPTTTTTPPPIITPTPNITITTRPPIITTSTTTTTPLPNITNTTTTTTTSPTTPTTTTTPPPIITPTPNITITTRPPIITTSTTTTTPPFLPTATNSTATTTPPPPIITTPSPSPTPTTPPTPPTSTTSTTTTTTTPTTPTTPAPLVCENGGELLNGVCICPDEWLGETCLEENFCEAKEGLFTFPPTPVGQFAYSEEKCSPETNNAGKPRASARCSKRNGAPAFEDPQELSCGQTLNDIQLNLTSPTDLEKLASNTQILTAKPEDLTPDNITTAAEIVQTLLEGPNVTENVRVAAVATVSQLLHANETDDNEQTNATLGLTLTLTKLSVNLSLTLNSSESQVVQPNLVVQSAQVPTSDTQGIQFTSLLGTSGTFSASRTSVNLNTSSVVVDQDVIPEALIFVRFPKEEAASKRATPSNVSVGFVLYQNDRFFRSRRYFRQRSTIRVLSGTIQGPLEAQHVEMMFRPQAINGTSLYEFACVFWDYSRNDWSTDGCSKGNISDGFLKCFCNHTTNFAALWTFRENYLYAEALDWISIAGLSFSIMGLVITIIHHLESNFFKFPGDSKRSMKARVVLLCIYLTLLAFIITFLSGSRNSSKQYDVSATPNVDSNIVPASEEFVEPDAGPCTAVTALLHFFLLASFLWNSVYGTQLVLLLRSLRSSLPPYWTKLSHALGWGVPTVIVAVTLGITYRINDPLGYRQEEFCWLAALDKAQRFDYGKPMFWGFLIPVGVILVYNVVLLVLTSMTACKTDKRLQSTKRTTLRKKVLISFSVAVLLGLSWILGYLVLVTSGRSQLVFSIVFCVCTTTQGFQIFILFTARTPTFRKKVSLSLSRMSEVNSNFHGRTYHLWGNMKSFFSFDTYKEREDVQYSSSGF